MKIAILGAGSLGCAFAIAFGARHEVALWGRNPEKGNPSLAGQEHPMLPGARLPQNILLTADMAEALRNADCAVCAVPSSAFEQTARMFDSAGCKAPFFWGTKGFCPRSRRLLSSVAQDVFGKGAPFGAILGPGFAIEIAKSMPTALAIATGDDAFSKLWAQNLSTDSLRLYASRDLPGIQICAALKNVAAIAAGACDRLELGNNAKAALCARALAEFSRLGKCFGAKERTFLGLAGAGDLMLTCNDDKSRNRSLGKLLASGVPLEQARQTLGHVSEGPAAAEAACALAEQYRVSMPICEAVRDVCRGQATPESALRALLSRPVKFEED